MKSILPATLLISTDGHPIAPNYNFAQRDGLNCRFWDGSFVNSTYSNRAGSMLIQTRHTHHKALLRLLQHVTACQGGQIRVAALAEIAGFSRAHFSRLFFSAIGEAPAEFERRLRLERACYQLQDAGISVAEAATIAEYANSEAFTRAFRSAYGCRPTQLGAIPGLCWRLHSPSGVHWLPTGRLREYRPVDNDGQEVRIVEKPPRHLAVIRHWGDYTESHVTWSELEQVGAFDDRG